MRLALAVGEVNVDRMLMQLSPRQLAEWQVFWSLEPFGPMVEDYHAALIATTIANYAGGRELPKGTNIKPTQWMLSKDREDRQHKADTDEQIKAMLMALARVG